MVLETKNSSVVVTGKKIFKPKFLKSNAFSISNWEYWKPTFLLVIAPKSDTSISIDGATSNNKFDCSTTLHDKVLMERDSYTCKELHLLCHDCNTI
jgi:hypothetical protein